MQKINTANQPVGKPGKIYLMGYPLYPGNKDMYSKYKQVDNIGSEDISVNYLEVRGSAFDDLQEEIDSEDEQNNYYSLGLDNHNDLEENWE